MSGGRWRYEDWKVNNLDVNMILSAIKLVLHEVDYSESGDKTRPEAEKAIYDTIKYLGDRLFGV
jgi:hypothetical protein